MARIDRLDIPQAKVEDYLLNLHHPEGGSKARFFLARGFRRDRFDLLADALAMQAMLNWPGDEMPGHGAVKHRISGPISCPDGSNLEILTVWLVREGSTIASLVTARPQRRKPPCPA